MPDNSASPEVHHDLPRDQDPSMLNWPLFLALSAMWVTWRIGASVARAESIGIADGYGFSVVLSALAVMPPVIIGARHLAMNVGGATTTTALFWALLLLPLTLFGVAMTPLMGPASDDSRLIMGLSLIGVAGEVIIPIVLLAGLTACLRGALHWLHRAAVGVISTAYLIPLAWALGFRDNSVFPLMMGFPNLDAVGWALPIVILTYEGLTVCLLSGLRFRKYTHRHVRGVGA